MSIVYVCEGQSLGADIHTCIISVHTDPPPTTLVIVNEVSLQGCLPHCGADGENMVV